MLNIQEPRCFNSWWTGLDCALASFGRNRIDRAKARDEFYATWAEKTAVRRLPFHPFDNYSLTTWLNNNYDIVEEWALDYLIAQEDQYLASISSDEERLPFDAPVSDPCWSDEAEACKQE